VAAGVEDGSVLAGLYFRGLEGVLYFIAVFLVFPEAFVDGVAEVKAVDRGFAALRADEVDFVAGFVEYFPRVGYFAEVIAGRLAGASFFVMARDHE
jgi:hypothetical protein